MGDSKACLLVIGVRVAHGYDQSGIACRFDAWRSAEHLRRNRDQPGISRRSLQETPEQVLRGRLDPFDGVHSATRLADKRALEMNAQNFSPGFLCRVLL